MPPHKNRNSQSDQHSVNRREVLKKTASVVGVSGLVVGVAAETTTADSSSATNSTNSTQETTADGSSDALPITTTGGSSDTSSEPFVTNSTNGTRKTTSDESINAIPKTGTTGSSNATLELTAPDSTNGTQEPIVNSTNSTRGTTVDGSTDAPPITTTGGSSDTTPEVSPNVASSDCSSSWDKRMAVRGGGTGGYYDIRVDGTDQIYYDPGYNESNDDVTIYGDDHSKFSGTVNGGGTDVYFYDGDIYRIYLTGDSVDLNPNGNFCRTTKLSTVVIKGSGNYYFETYCDPVYVPYKKNSADENDYVGANDDGYTWVGGRVDGGGIRLQLLEKSAK